MQLPGYRDVVVVGGGPAGLAAAIAARRKGFSVAVLEYARPPIDKACGEGLMPDGVAALRALGVTLESTDSYRFRGIRFLGQGLEAKADFPAGLGFGIRRTVFHEILAANAVSAGVDLLWGTGATGLSAKGVLTSGGELCCRWIVGADGGNSRVRLWAGLDTCRTSLVRFGFRRHYDVAPWSEYVEVYWGDRFQIYVTPVSAGQVCVALVSRDSRLRLDGVIPAFPALQRRLRIAAAGMPERGAITASRNVNRVVRDRVALIGDASGTVDAVTGEGLCLAFRQALALADSLESGSLEPYASAHGAIVRQTRRMAKLLLLMDRYSWFRNRALAALAAHPELFGRLLAAHVHKLAPVDFLRRGLELGYHLITL